MKFIYEYRTRENVPCKGEISAPTKEAAYDILKSRGIRPGKVWEAPGLLNKLFGKGKRWGLIFILAIALIGVLVYLNVLSNEKEAATKELGAANRELADIIMFEDRGQIYGPDAVLKGMRRDGFISVFGDDAVSRFLAAYAIPGVAVDRAALSFPKGIGLQEIDRVVEISDNDMEEVKKLKRIVNGMRREFAQYLRDGGSVLGYLQRLDIRQKAEYGIYNRVKASLLHEKNLDVWQERNRMLRLKGLPMVDPPDLNL